MKLLPERTMKVFGFLLIFVSNINAQPTNYATIIFDTLVPDEIEIGYADRFENYKTIEKIQNSKIYPLPDIHNDVIIFQSNTSRIPILVQYGDVLNISVKNLFPFIVVKDKRKQEMLNFFAELSKRDESIADFRQRMVVALHPKYKINKSKLNIDSLFIQGNRYLESKKSIYSEDIYHLYKKIILSYYLEELFGRYLTNRINYDDIEPLIMQHRSFFQESEMLSYSIYREMMYKYAKVIQKSRGVSDFQALIGEYFVGNFKNILLYQVLRKTDKKSPEFPQYLAKFYSECSDPELVQYVRENLDIQGLQINMDQVQVIKASDTKEVILWQSILEKYKGKVIYIDFWASWCSPCIAEFAAGERLKQAYSGKDVVFVYVSTDDDIGAWRSIAKSHGLDNYAHSYLLLNQETSPLNGQINLQEIPRYVIYDKQGRLIDKDAPRPSDAAVLQKLDAAIRQ